jgi:hypothetical protein
MSSRRPTDDALVVEEQLISRATSAGQGNRTRPREHGDLATYQWGLAGKDRSNGCRCHLCVESKRAYSRRHARQRTARAGGGFVRLGDIRPHVRVLLCLGWTYTRIAEHAQVTPTAVARIASHGRSDDDVKRHVAHAILAVPAVAPSRLTRLQLDEALRERARAVIAGEWKPERDPSRYATDDAWIADAACAGLDPESMYPGQGDSLAAIRALCDVCPAQLDCQEAGLREPHGIWGGTTEKQRRRLRQRRGLLVVDESEVA